MLAATIYGLPAVHGEGPLSHSVSLLILAVVLVLGACAPATGSQQSPSQGGLSGEIRIGAVWSLTGGGAVYGASQQKAAELAVAALNDGSYLGSGKITLITEDDRSTKEGAQAAFEKLINQDKVVALLGPTLSANALAADPIAQAKKIVVLGVSNTAGGITEMGDFVFRNSLPESAVQPNTIKATQTKLGYKRVALMYGDDDAFTKAGYDVFKAALDQAKVEILTTETFKRGDTDYSAQLTKIRTLNPDAIVVSALAEEAAGIMSQARQLGIPATVRFIGGNGFNSPQLAKLAGPAAEGAISGAAWFVAGSTAPNKTFVDAYRTKYGASPDQFSAQAYAGVYLMASALKSANSSNPLAIRDALLKMKDVDTVLGKFSFSPGREPIHDPVVQVIKNGEFALFQ
ncbi:MAG: amino acid/amide transporter substrate-binding protein, family [Chloroflexi bacterium]|nr:amino acid/amide transporter substrate-binding protein, family [Chloroflexota bacterium]